MHTPAVNFNEEDEQHAFPQQQVGHHQAQPWQQLPLRNDFFEDEPPLVIPVPVLGAPLPPLPQFNPPPVPQALPQFQLRPSPRNLPLDQRIV